MMRATPTTRGFSLVELLVVIVVIALLISIAAPAFMSVRAGAMRTSCESQLQTMASSIDQFRNDFGYLPPLILDDPAVDQVNPEWCTSLTARDDARDRLESERYHSLYSMSVYLLGLGALSPDTMSDNPDRHDGVAGPGFRDPGPDRAWGGARVRDTTTHRVAPSGRPYEPYVDYANTDRVRPASSNLGDFREDSSVNPDDDDEPWRRMVVILDPWGSPIRYYRAWPTRVEGVPGDSLLDAPAEIVLPKALADAPPNSATFDATLDMELARGDYVLLSSGRDRLFTPSGFAQQGMAPRGSVNDYLNEDDRSRRRLLREGIEDNVRLVR